MPKLLLIEDDDKISDFIIKYALSENYEILREPDGRSGLETALCGGCDLIILDIGLPGLSGLQLCSELRKTSGVPVIFLTAKDEEIDKVLALEIGADDYITKPFSPRELFARIKAILRRTSPGANSASRPASNAPEPDAKSRLRDECATVIENGPLKIDVKRREVRLGAAAVSLTYTQFEILKKLASNPGIVYSREEIYVAVWGEDGEGMSRTVDVHIKHLRHALAEALEGYAPIVSVRGAGYKFEENPCSNIK